MNETNSVINTRKLNQLTKECREKVQAALGASFLALDKAENSVGHTIYKVKDPEGPVVTLGKRDLNLILLDKTEQHNYWITVVVEINKGARSSSLISTSIGVFRSEIEYQSPNPVPLFRAEWMFNVGENHAQPHWHVYPDASYQALELHLKEVSANRFSEEVAVRAFDADVQIVDFASKISVLDDQTEIESKSAALWDEGPHFHFAMASIWHEQDNSNNKVKIDPHKLPTWLKRCIIYIKEQMEYLKKKV